MSPKGTPCTQWHPRTACTCQQCTVHTGSRPGSMKNFQVRRAYWGRACVSHAFTYSTPPPMRAPYCAPRHGRELPDSAGGAIGGRGGGIKPRGARSAQRKRTSARSRQRCASWARCARAGSGRPHRRGISAGRARSANHGARCVPPGTSGASHTSGKPGCSRVLPSSTRHTCRRSCLQRHVTRRALRAARPPRLIPGGPAPTARAHFCAVGREHARGTRNACRARPHAV